MKTLKFFIIIFIISISVKSFSQTDRTFWFVAPEVTISHDDNRYYNEFGVTYRGGEPIFFVFSTRDLASKIIITQPANPAFDTITINLAANSTERVNLTDRIDMIENKYVNGGFSNKGLLIESTELITAYYEVYTQNNPDLFALKGKNALGTEFLPHFKQKHTIIDGMLQM
jgi:hypothetical protein